MEGLLLLFLIIVLFVVWDLLETYINYKESVMNLSNRRSKIADNSAEKCSGCVCCDKTKKTKNPNG